MKKSAILSNVIMSNVENGATLNFHQYGKPMALRMHKEGNLYRAELSTVDTHIKHNYCTSADTIDNVVKYLSQRITKPNCEYLMSKSSTEFEMNF